MDEMTDEMLLDELEMTVAARLRGMGCEHAATARAAVLARMGPPPGWRLVPVEPTDEMAEAAYQEVEMSDAWCIEDDTDWKRSYRAALTAAPRSPAESAP